MALGHPPSLEIQVSGGRIMFRGWCIMPGAFVGLWLWIGFFKLIGVL